MTEGHIQRMNKESNKDSMENRRGWYKEKRWRNKAEVNSREWEGMAEDYEIL